MRSRRIKSGRSMNIAGREIPRCGPPDVKQLFELMREG